MPRINPRLDPHELADLMAAPEHWVFCFNFS